MSSRPSERATDTRWWPSRTKCSSPMRKTEIGGNDSPRRWASAIRCQRARSRGLVGRKARSNSFVRSTVPTIESSGMRLQPEVVLGHAPERLDDLLEGEDVADVVGLEAQPPPEVREHPRPPRPREVVLRVLGGETGAAHALCRVESP